MTSSHLATLIPPKKDITLDHWDVINKICKPLSQYGISFFNYMKVYDDGTIIDLNNAPELHNYFYYETKSYLDCVLFKRDLALTDGFVTLSSIYDKQFIKLAKEQFDIDHIVFFAVKLTDSTIYWEFGTHAENDKIINFYLNNTEFLKSFTYHFEKAGEDLITLGESNRYKIHTELLNNDISNNHDICFFDNSMIKHELRRFILGTTSLNLTSKEIECLKLCSTGKTAEEISTSLIISKRTVESHLKNVKDKLHCSSIAQAISKGHLLQYL